MKTTLRHPPSLRGSRQADAAIHFLPQACKRATALNHHQSNKTTEHGNVFFYILLAVALFAALTYAVSRNNEGNIDIFTEEQAKIAAQEIIEYGNTIANTVQKLRLRGCKDTEISFENNLSATDYAHGFSPVDKSCHIFDTNGGNIAYAFPPKISQTYEDSEGAYFQNLFNQYRFSGRGAMQDVGTDEAELFLYKRMRKSYPNATLICNYINQQLGVAYTVGDGADTVNLNNWSPFLGIYTAAPLGASSTVGDQMPVFAGKTAACFHESHGGSELAYYQVLIAR